MAGINGYQFEWYGFFMAFFAHAYYSWGGDREPEDFVLQAEEVSEVRWFDFDDCLRILFDGTVPSCVYEEELNLLKPALGL